jgi:hypothetical protein
MEKADPDVGRRMSYELGKENVEPNIQTTQ